MTHIVQQALHASPDRERPLGLSSILQRIISMYRQYCHPIRTSLGRVVAKKQWQLSLLQC
jgi:hypothetical protein